MRFADKGVATVLADVGGFGVSSDLTWQALGGIEYRFNETWSLKAGYRAMGVDYRNAGLKLDGVPHGPAIGVGIRF